MEVVVERCAALDVHKDTVMACVRRPTGGSKRGHQVREFRTYTATLRELRAWLAAEGVTAVAMEATGCIGGLCGRRWRTSRRCRVVVGQRASCQEPAGPQDRCE